MKRWAPLIAGAALCARGEELPLWELGAGATALSFPDYRGSSKQRAYVLPIPVFVYRGEMFKADRDKLRGIIYRSEPVDVELSVSGSVPVESGDNPAREGMPDLDPTLELGPSPNFRLAHSERYTLRLRLPVRAIIASDFRSVHGAGVVANPNLNLDFRLDDGWRLGLVAGALWGTRRNHAYFYDVAPEFAREGRPAYSAPGGYAGSQSIIALSKRTGAWFVAGFLRHDYLKGAAFAASPLVEERNNLTAGIAVTWTFKQSAERVIDRD